jgi:hypothetical protein
MTEDDTEIDIALAPDLGINRRTVMARIVNRRRADVYPPAVHVPDASGRCRCHRDVEAWFAERRPVDKPIDEIPPRPRTTG